MARLSAFKIDSQKIETGEWVKPGEEYDDLEILTRGFTDTYTDARASKMRRAAVGFGGDVSKVPAKIARAINAECMISHVLLDVRGLVHDDGRAVTFAEFGDAVRNPDYMDMFVAAIKAASQVGLRRSVDLAEAVGEDAPGNSATPSESPSNGAASAT